MVRMDFDNEEKMIRWRIEFDFFEEFECPAESLGFLKLYFRLESKKKFSWTSFSFPNFL